MMLSLPSIKIELVDLLSFLTASTQPMISRAWVRERSRRLDIHLRDMRLLLV